MKEDKELLKSYKIALAVYERALTYACTDFGLNPDPVLIEELKRDYIDIASYELSIEKNPVLNKE